MYFFYMTKRKNVKVDKMYSKYIDASFSSNILWQLKTNFLEDPIKPYYCILKQNVEIFETYLPCFYFSIWRTRTDLYVTLFFTENNCKNYQWNQFVIICLWISKLIIYQTNQFKFLLISITLLLIPLWSLAMCWLLVC